MVFANDVYRILLFALIFAWAFIALGSGIAEEQGKSSTETTGILVTAGIWMYMNFCTCMNRLRDSGRHWAFYFLFHLPLIGLPAMIYFCGIEEGSPRMRSIADTFGEPEYTPFSQTRQYQPQQQNGQFGQRTTFGQRRS